MPRCDNHVPAGQTCPRCGQTHAQVKSRIGGGLIMLGVLAVIAGLGIYAWSHREYGAYDAYGAW